MLERFLVPKEDQILIESESMTHATKEIFVKIRSTGRLIKSKLEISGNSGNVELLEKEYGISPGQACVFYKKDNNGDKLLGGYSDHLAIRVEINKIK